jgi:hypothetical protein
LLTFLYFWRLFCCIVSDPAAVSDRYVPVVCDAAVNSLAADALPALDKSGVSAVAGVPALVAVSAHVGHVGNPTAPLFPAVSGVPSPAGVPFFGMAPLLLAFLPFYYHIFTLGTLSVCV